MEAFNFKVNQYSLNLEYSKIFMQFLETIMKKIMHEKSSEDYWPSALQFNK